MLARVLLNFSLIAALTFSVAMLCVTFGSIQGAVYVALVSGPLHLLALIGVMVHDFRTKRGSV